MKFTFFHVLNGDKVVTNMEKAKFEEKGPYAYKVILYLKPYIAGEGGGLLSLSLSY